MTKLTSNTLTHKLFLLFVYRQLAFAKEGFTEASLGLLANQRRRQLLTGLLKSLRTIKTLVTTVFFIESS